MHKGEKVKIRKVVICHHTFIAENDRQRSEKTEREKQHEGGTRETNVGVSERGSTITKKKKNGVKGGAEKKI